MNATLEQMNAILAGSEPYVYLNISADGGIQPNSYNLDDEGFAAAEIVKTPEGYSVTIRRNGKLMGIDINNATYDVLTAARSAFEPLGYGTPAAWNTLMEWAVNKFDVGR